MYWTFSINTKYNTPGFASQGGNGYGSTALSGTQVALFDSHYGKAMPVANINLRMQDNGTKFTWAGAHKPALDAIHNDGRIPFCTWGLWDLGNRANNQSLSLANIAAGNQDAYFNDFFAGAATCGYDFWVRPWWEFNVRDMWVANGNFPWCVGSIVDGGHTWTNWAPVLGGVNPADGSSNSDFVRAWRHVIALRNAHGAQNVNFVWCPNGQASSAGAATNPARTGPLSDFWPSAANVDLMGPDLYQSGYGGGSISAAGGTWKSLYEIMTGSSGTGLLNTWQNIINCDESGKIQMCIPEHNANLTVFVTASDSTGRIGRAAYLKDLWETSVPALPRMALMSIFAWYGTGDVYVWQEYDDGSPSLDAPNHSPDVSGNANFNTSLQDFAAAKNAIGGSMYPDKSQIVLPANGKPIRPYWLEDVPDRYRKGKHNQQGLVGYWRGVDLASPLADDSGNGRTAVAEGTVSYGNATVVPSNPTDSSVGIAGGTTNDFTIADADAFSAVTTNALYVEMPFTIAAYPASGNAHIIAKGAPGQFEYSLLVTSTGQIFWNGWDLTAFNGSAAFYAGPAPLNKRILAQLQIDNVAKQLSMVLSSEDGGSWGDLVNTSAGYTLTMGNGTAPLDLGRRAETGNQGHNGNLGHPSVHSALPSTTTLQQNYKNWIAAPTISSPSSGTPTTTLATITWTTNIAGTSWVEYGTTTAYGKDSGLINPALVTSHSITLTGLLPGTLYHYRIHSRNPGGTDSVTADATFVTPGGTATYMMMTVVT